MNISISYLRNNENFDKNIVNKNAESLNKLNQCFKILVNMSDHVLDDSIYKFFNLNIDGEETNHAKNMNFYNFLMHIIDQYSETNNNLILNDISKSYFNKNPFEFMNFFNKKLYFHNHGPIFMQTNEKLSSFKNLIKALGYGDADGNNYYINPNIICGNSDYIKFVLHLLKSNSNRMTLEPITMDAILSYLSDNLRTHKNIMFTHKYSDNFCLSFENFSKENKSQLNPEDYYILLD